MNDVGFRALRFDLDGASGVEGNGFLLSRGRLAMVDEDAAVRQSILLLLATRPGERVMRPRYGCDLARILFWPNDDATAGMAQHYVRRALEAWVPKIQVLALDARRDEDEPGILRITLDYRVRATQHRHNLSLGVSLEGAAP